MRAFRIWRGGSRAAVCCGEPKCPVELHVCNERAYPTRATMLNRWKLRSLWRERLWGKRSHTFREVCAREWILQKSDTQLCSPSIYFAEQLDRVTAIQHETTREKEDCRLRGGEIQHAATIAYLLRDVELVEGWLYSRSMRSQAADRPQHLLVPRVDETQELAAISSSLPGNTYFGHWLSDDLVRHLAAETLARPVMVDRGTNYTHEVGYCQLLGIKQCKLSRARFKELIVLDDFGQNAFKSHRYAELKKRLRNSIREAGSKYIYIRRGTEMARARRQLVNAIEVETFLESRGFVIVDPDKQSAAEIATVTLDARIIVGVEGSHLIHALLPIAEGGTIWCLQPPDRFNNVLKDFADCIRANYAFVVGNSADGGFKVPIDDMERMLNHLHQ